ncbi:MAG: class I SAM-dependent methyltransferase [Candidatus Brocadiae bacterium]|nr:class I SAM-dependent methyltransferase [Candidatus Brocadiia bacterium]
MKPSGRLDFGTIADRYDRWYAEPLGSTYDRLEKRAIKAVLPPAVSGQRLLEVGSGTGHWSSFFAAQGYRVSGVDVSEEMVRVASAKGIGGATFAVAAGEQLPFGDDAFDVAACITVLEFAERPAAVVAEMARCTRAGGKLVVGVLNRHSLLALLRRLKRSRTYAAARFFSPRELERLLCARRSCAVRPAAFVLPWRWALWTAAATDRIGRALNLPWGDFLVGEVQL